VDAGFSLLTAHDLLTKDVDELKALVAQRREAEAKRSRQADRQAGFKAERRGDDAGAAGAAQHAASLHLGPSKLFMSVPAAWRGGCTAPSALSCFFLTLSLCHVHAGAAAAEPMDEDEAPGSTAQRIPASDVTVLEGHTSEVFTCAWSPSSALVLASGSGDGTARIWTLPSGGGAPKAVVLRHTPGDGDGETGNAPPGGDGDGSKSKDVTTLDWSADGSQLATGSYDGVARLWDASSGALVRTFVRHSGPIFSLRWNKRGDKLLTGSADKSAIVWDAATGQVVQAFSVHSGPTLDGDWKDDTTFATSSTDCRILVCRLGDAQPLRQLQGHSSEVNAVRWDPTGTMLASCSDDGTAKVWDMSQLGGDSSSGSGAVQPRHVLHGHTKEIYTIKWSPTGPGSANPGVPLVLATASFDATVRLWDAGATGACLCVLRGHKEPVYSVAFSPDGRHVASGSFDRWLHIWRVDSGRAVRSFQGGGGIFEVGWSAQDSNSLAASFANSTVCVINARLH
jgi:transducin (beta)-like 1